MIQLKNVSKVYPSKLGEVRALDDLTLHIREGRFVAVRGPSGCGKSTLLSVTGSLVHPTSGTVEVAGENLADMSPAHRAAFRGANIGFVFQMFHLLPYLSVLDNVLVAATRRTPDVRDDATALLGRFGLDDRITHRPGQLSAGERQRVAMARALLNRPSILLADEPTGNLDPDNAAALLELVADFHRDGGTVLLVTHDAKAAQYAEETIHLDHGRLVSGTVEEAAT